MHLHGWRGVFQFLFGTALVLAPASAAWGQETPAASRAERPLRALEDELFTEINRLRADPEGYAERVIRPLSQRLLRVPGDKSEPFLAFRAYLVGGTEIDYLTLDEGGSEETARAMLDDTMKALRAAPKLPQLQRNVVLDRAARFFSQDFLEGGPRRDPHIDSLGRKPGARIRSYGTSRESLDSWQRFIENLPADGTAVARVFRKEGRYYWLAYSGERAYRYWSVPDELGQFVAEHGRQKTLARLDQPGYECKLNVDRRTRTLRHGDAQVPYPFLLPAYGENVTWGNWSRDLAARGMVCWWLVDPGIPSRGHRQTLLDPDYKYAGIGCARSRSIGWVATLDACAEPLAEFPGE